jgi:hypothetical protein
MKILFRIFIRPRRTVCSCVLLLLASTTASADICLFKMATVSHIQGEAKAYEDPLEGVSVEVWKSDAKGARVSLVTKSETDSSGYFSVSNTPSGWYRLTFPLQGFDGDDFLVHLQGRSILRLFPKNWLQVGLGITSFHCPETHLKATRNKTTSGESR